MANDSRKESNTNESIKGIRRFFDKNKKKDSKISSLRRKRSPMERDRVISKMKSDAKAVGGNFRTMDEMSPLKGESQKSFDSRTSSYRKGGSVKKKSSGKAIRGKGCEIR